MSTLHSAGILATTEGGMMLAPFHLRTVRGLFLISDYLEGHPDAVMGAGESTAILYQAARGTHRTGSALDLGCGADTLALLLSRDSDSVIGTDMNPRAIALARFNTA